MGITKQSLSGGGGGELELKERLMSGLGGADALELQPRRDTRPDRGREETDDKYSPPVST